ncbi:YcnI family protein [Actinoallomurus sp. NBC_01490]|uniref:YcnI family copper-binding membrane protein n=1 Tax=Actinoallomurus sp. NBC_01490 TaxID=2903557 RepID=UPI002E377680|nr:YcnI family protein [Actinoallomurus sp. NBC_01490]
MVRTVHRVIVPLICASVLVVTGALAAAAHVVLRPNTATQGDFTKLTFHVPNEAESADTVKVKIVLPDAQQDLIPAAVVQTKAGWTVNTEKRKLDTPVVVEGKEIWEVLSSVTWTAKDSTARIRPEQFDEVALFGGPLPSVDKIYFKAYQYYSDGSVVSWDQIPSDSDPNPAHPAPALLLSPPGGTPSGQSGATGEHAAFNGAGGVRLTAAEEKTSEARPTGSSMLSAAVPVAVLLLGGMAVGLLLGRRRWARTNQGE